ncbi:MAG: dehydrogenase [Chthonomonadaceae bacterium]|nr:dehydrogenase [Chthonomonadaceae bacterium]
MLPIDDYNTLAQFFHLNSSPWANPNPKEEYPILYKQVGEPKSAVALPVPEDSRLLDLLRTRRSCRAFLPQTMPVSELSTLLAGAYAVIGMGQLPDARLLYRRTAPSAGGLYPLELYLTCQRVEGLEDGLYHYSMRDHSLEPIRFGTLFPGLSRSLINQTYLNDANVICLFSGVFDRSLVKYGPRGYRYILMEAGHAAQNLCLMALERRLGSVCMGGFFDAEVNQFLGIDGIQEAALYCVGLGYPAV